MSITLRQIRYFVAVAEQGSVSATAQSISISQSTITETIQELEIDLGFRLFERHARGVELTLKGHQFLRHARKILTDVQDARRALRGEIAEGSGRLALGVTPLVAGYVLSDLVNGFNGAFPEVNVETVEELSQYLEHLLVGGELDVAVMVLPVDMYAPALQTELVEVSAYRMWLPLGHRATRKVRVSFRDLDEDTPYVLLTVDQVAQTVEAAWRDLGIRPEGGAQDQLGGSRARAGRFRWARRHHAGPHLSAVVARWRQGRSASHCRGAAAGRGRRGVAAWFSAFDDRDRFRQYGDDAQSCAQALTALVSCRPTEI